jgi:hypothetical protein
MVMRAFVCVVFAVAIVCALVELNTHRNDRCIESHTEVVTTYPYMGMLGLGPEYTAIALIPEKDERTVCTKWGRGIDEGEK